MSFESSRNKKSRELPLGYQHSLREGQIQPDDPLYDFVEKFNLHLGAFHTESDLDKNQFGSKYMKEDVILMLLHDGWLPSVDTLKKTFDDRDSILDFIVNLAWLRHESKEAGLSDDEINELKSNVGLISIDQLRESLKEKA
jgi:hypothetical protein